MRFLVFGDVVGEAGRRAVTLALPDLRREYEPDCVIVNVENIAHGRGISPNALAEAKGWNAQVLTTGDHAWDNRAGLALLDDSQWPLIRPANYGTHVAGRGYTVFSHGAWQVAVINLQGQVFFKNHPGNPFHALDELLKIDAIARANVILVDFHAEATSEKRAFGWHVDGRVTAMWGTHTHVPTADAHVLPNGTGYISDVGMNGGHYSVIGGDRTLVKGFLTQVKVPFSVADSGPLEVGALVIDTDPTQGVTTHIEHVRRIIET